MRAVAGATVPCGGPVHVNFPFREPLIGCGEPRTYAAAPRFHAPVFDVSARAVNDIAALLENAARPLIVCGAQPDASSLPALLAEFAARQGAPLLADPLSQARVRAAPDDNVIFAYDALLRDERFAARMEPDFVMCFGAFPRSKAPARYLRRHARPTHVVIELWRNTMTIESKPQRTYTGIKYQTVPPLLLRREGGVVHCVAVAEFGGRFQGLTSTRCK